VARRGPEARGSKRGAGGVMRTLLAIPVYNEERYVERVLERVRKHATDVLVIDDGSTDSTPSLLAKFPVDVIRHRTNRGYGRSMQDAFRLAALDGFEWVITMDCDEQHEPASIPQFMAAAARDEHDVISGSRYLIPAPGDDCPPPDRQRINREMTGEINRRLGLSLTDAFCGFKAYRVEAVRRLRLTEDGYAFPMQFWVQAVANGLRITEIPVRLIYKDANRSFGGPLDDPEVRIGHYRKVLHCELERCADRLPTGALADLHAGCRGT
jgi:glycosyltransferase involved in cell wall biosynthesis